MVAREVRRTPRTEGVQSSRTAGITETMKVDLNFEGEPPPELLAGVVCRIDHVIGESGAVVGYKVINAATGEQVAFLRPDQVRVER